MRNPLSTAKHGLLTVKIDENDTGILIKLNNWDSLIQGDSKFGVQVSKGCEKHTSKQESHGICCYKHGKSLPSNLSLMVRKRVLQRKVGYDRQQPRLEP
ncbi:hypothetical protein AVEN_67863-1 [Araneus ventricosus]|uniref:Uncharacterized protein n=1 Tax=Araneus ventricosus TaxID=182803 RepID=A0A4Y2NTH9_ARAVE|nr:hypothetical protein AVEN_67863-1 [Araneus ventricosus]